MEEDTICEQRLECQLYMHSLRLHSNLLLKSNLINAKGIGKFNNVRESLQPSPLNLWILFITLEQRKKENIF